MKKLLLILVVLTITGYGQTQKTVTPTWVKTTIQDSLDNFRLRVDTILTGTATINVGADSVIVTHGLGSAPTAANIDVRAEGDLQGFDIWKEDITSTTFKVKIGSTGYEALTTPLTISWSIFNADVSSVTQFDSTSLSNRINTNISGIDSIATEYSESSFQSIGSKLMNWKLDFIQSNYRNQNNAKIAFLGDSYVAPYSYMLQLRSQELYGNGGIGYLPMNPAVYASTGLYDLAVSGWTTGTAEDTLSIHGYYATNNDITTNTIKVTRTLFNVLKVHYKQVSGGGEFRYKVNYGGAWLDTINTDGATASKTSYYKWASTKNATTDTLYINAISGTVRVYGLSLTYEPIENSKNKAVEFHRLNRGGTSVSQWLAMSDDALSDLLDSLDVSIVAVAFLESVGSIYADYDSLVTKLQSAKSDMDILLISPNQVASANQSESHRDTLQLIANNRGIAYYDFFNRFGSYSEASDLGLISDGVHLTGGIGSYYPAMELFNVLFPQTPYKGSVYAQNIITLGTESEGIVLESSGRTKYLNHYDTGSWVNGIEMQSNGRTYIRSENNIYLDIDNDNNATNSTFNVTANNGAVSPLVITDAATPTIAITGTTSITGLTTIGSTGTQMTFIKSITDTLDFGSINPDTSAVLTITLGGIANGDPVFLGIPTLNAIDGIIYQAHCTNSTTVTIRAYNVSDAAIDPPSGIFRVVVIKF